MQHVSHCVAHRPTQAVLVTVSKLFFVWQFNSGLCVADVDACFAAVSAAAAWCPVCHGWCRLTLSWTMWSLMVDTLLPTGWLDR
jgi:hypothetical protein